MNFSSFLMVSKITPTLPTNDLQATVGVSDQKTDETPEMVKGLTSNSSFKSGLHTEQATPMTAK